MLATKNHLLIYLTKTGLVAKFHTIAPWYAYTRLSAQDRAHKSQIFWRLAIVGQRVLHGKAYCICKGKAARKGTDLKKY